MIVSFENAIMAIVSGFDPSWCTIGIPCRRPELANFPVIHFLKTLSNEQEQTETNVSTFHPSLHFVRTYKT